MEMYQKELLSLDYFEGCLRQDLKVHKVLGGGIGEHMQLKSEMSMLRGLGQPTELVNVYHSRNKKAKTSTILMSSQFKNRGPDNYFLK